MDDYFEDISNDDTLVASFEVIKKIVEEKQFQFLKWPDESKNKVPLIVDVNTANIICKAHATCSDMVKELIESRIKESRKRFMGLVTICWRLIK